MILSHSFFVVTHGNETVINVLSLVVDGVVRLTMSSNSTEPMQFTGDVSFAGRELLLGPEQHSALLASENGRLVVNPNSDFVDGIVLGQSGMHVNATGTMSVGLIGPLSHYATIESGAGIRARKGVAVVDADDVGFSFGPEDGDTGLFATDEVVSALVLQVDGSTVLRLPSSRANNDVAIYGNVTIAGNRLSLGLSSDRVLELEELRRSLMIGQDAVMLGGVYVGDEHVGVHALDSSNVRVGIGRTVSSTPQSTLHVDGGVRVSKGLPSSDASNVGVSFDADGGVCRTIFFPVSLCSFCCCCWITCVAPLNRHPHRLACSFFQILESLPLEVSIVYVFALCLVWGCSCRRICVMISLQEQAPTPLPWPLLWMEKLESSFLHYWNLPYRSLEM